MRCTWVWQDESYEFELRFFPAGKSLVIEVEGPVGARGVSLGRVQDVSPTPDGGARVVEVPYWSLATDAYREGNPKVLSRRRPIRQYLHGLVRFERQPPVRGAGK